MESPPKRITRARAAAKGTGSTVKTTKIVTAASKAKAAAASTASSKVTKRKTRSDDDDEAGLGPEDKPSPPKKANRGRPKKAGSDHLPTTSVPATRSTRTSRAVQPATTTQATTSETNTAPVRATRGRPRKVAQPEPTQPAEPTIQSRPIRARATATTKTGAKSTATATTQSALKKSVKFQEPDKENLGPAPKKEAVPTGLRGRPAKKRGPATASTSSAQKTAPGEKKPLSPKKVTQVPVCRDYESEDELAGGGYTPTIKALQRSPVKPPHNAHPSAPADELQEPDATDPDSTMQVNEAILNPPTLGLTVLASPARRAPSSPFKGSMKSPARKIGAVSFPDSALRSVSKGSGLEQPSPCKNSLLQSSAKRPPSPIKGLQLGVGQTPQKANTPFKASMFQSPAKRAMPGLKPLLENREAETGNLHGSPTRRAEMQPLQVSESRRPSEKLLLGEDGPNGATEDGDDEIFMKPLAGVQFSGRLSAVLPRNADPDDDTDVFGSEEDLVAQPIMPSTAAQDVDVDIDEVDETTVDEPSHSPAPRQTSGTVDSDTDESIIVEEIVVQTKHCIVAAGVDEGLDDVATQAHGPPSKSSFELREKDLESGDGLDSDSEDDTHLQTMATPTSHSLGVSQRSRRSTLGFTALADQFGAWSATSPAGLPRGETTEEPTPPLKGDRQRLKASPLHVAPVDVNFFEDEMHVSRDESHSGENVMADQQPPLTDGGIEDPILDNIVLVDEDVDLIHEANELSLMDSKQQYNQDDSLSEASQEYGDENMVPIDPRMEERSHLPVTPVRPAQQRVFHTTTKVPLKPAAEHTPSPLKKRTFSASRVAPRRPGAPRSASKTRGQSMPRPALPTDDEANQADIWSAVGSPARTPRKDLNPGLLRGAVVHVDVHTSEGADASGIFVELLNNMGAKCVKTWHWNPDSNTNDESASNKIGITHVVYKDGGKRTLEKVRRTNGVVQCVGVSWVLDCERENEWLDEASYYIDTSLVPRGGARRRKSMEPKALANMNGTLISNNAGRGHSNGVSSLEENPVPRTPRDRRQSAMWMHTPSDHGAEEEDDDDDIEWSKFILTPVPKTPAPEAVSRYAAELLETPGGSNDDDIDDSPSKEVNMTRTCPPKPSSRHVVAGSALSRDGEEHLMLRLMTARRKSLQFAPKIGSPLAKAWL